MLTSTAICACAVLFSGNYVPAKLYRIQEGDSFARVAALNSTGYERLLTANPGLEPERLKPGIVILVPARVNGTPTGMQATTPPKQAAGTPKTGAHTVRNGENDWTIAARYGLKPSELRKMNPGVDWDNLRIGISLKVPGTEKVASTKPTTPASTAPAKTSAPKTSSYTVVKNDNDWVIAKKLGTTPSKLRALNPGVEWGRLQIGAKLNVPGGAKAPASAPKISTKRVAISRDDVSVRDGAKISARRRTTVAKGTMADVRDKIGDWYKLEFSTGLVGWVRQDMLKAVSAAEAAKKTAPKSTNGSGNVAKNTTKKKPASSSSKVAKNSKPAPRLSEKATDSLLDTAYAQMGIKYVWAGTSRSGFDCSGFTTYVFKKHGVSIPRTSISQSQHGWAVPRNQLQAGDLVFFSTRGGSRVSHVGIYVGNNKFIHASSGAGRVVVTSLGDGYYNKRYRGARRVTGVKPTSTPEAPQPASTPKPKDEAPAKTQDAPPVKADDKKQEDPPAKADDKKETEKSGAGEKEEAPSRVRTGITAIGG